ncbi:hypothetical protein SLEP1_g9396 [Rubroshorea leprosula]|uniref:Uncharacterized protein n=1 Tax=Rubroshorea leprosula TaxID=152421 RepID=A0AAV5IEN6_9ROSI|nr:hypothetical protein SLEP1_g9396 [Rubroshorea leprosula]
MDCFSIAEGSPTFKYKLLSCNFLTVVAIAHNTHHHSPSTDPTSIAPVPLFTRRHGGC